MPISYEQEMRAVEGVKQVATANWFGAIYKEPKNFFPQFAVSENYFDLYPEFIIDEAEFAAQATEYAATPVTDRYPHQLTLSVDDLAASFESRPTCDVNTAGTPVPCDFWGIFNSGPWWYNELPANLPFTLTFINTSSVTTHISSPELGFDVELAGNQQVDIDVDADPGKYAVDFVQGDLTSTWTLEFEPVDGGRFSIG